MAVPSQLSPADVKALKSIMHMVSQHGAYRYLEIGSYLGASLQWHLTNDRCTSVVSVDLRSQEKIRDERPIDYRYTVTTQDMLSTLKKNNIPINKLHCVEGTIDDLITQDKFELAFIDAEHTDQAVYHDACACMAWLQPNAVLVFHDDWIIYQGIENFEQHLVQAGKKFRKSKLSNSDITVVALGEWCDAISEQLPSVGDWGKFRSAAQIRLKRKS